jgi:hypothetical protein
MVVMFLARMYMSLSTAVAGRATQCTCEDCMLQLGICCFEIVRCCEGREIWC